MHRHPSRRRVPATLCILAAAAVVAVWCATAFAAAPRHGSTLAGTWSGHYSGAFAGTFTLRWRQVKSRLVGSITLSAPHGKYSITGSVRGTAIKFGAVGVGATYTGSVSGTSMSGHWKSPQGGGSWSATKTS